MKRILLNPIKKNYFQKLKDININDQAHFIGSWNIENNNLCNEIINFFETNKQLHRRGQSGLGLDNKIKQTTDLTITPGNLKDEPHKCIKKYIDELYKCFIDYQKQWPFIKQITEQVNIGSFNIQKYSPGDHFSRIHTERGNLHSLHRLFAWMIYLNDVEDGGATNFSHYGMKIKPEIGKILIWPAEWTHAHSGEVVKNGVKYIITGWMNFPYEDHEI